MRRVASRLWNILSRLAERRSLRSGTRTRPVVRLELCPLEDRVVPSASNLGTVTGLVVVSGGVSAQQASLQGIQVTLTGTSNVGDAVNLSATTDAQGDFAFRSVEAGSYELSAASGATLLQGGAVADVSVVAGQNTVQNVGVGGLAAQLISLRDFLSSTTSTTLGLPGAGATANSPPVVSSPIANVVVASGGSTTIDLAASFSDPDTTNSQIVFDTSDGAMTVNLNDAQAPQTVANFLDYVENSRYNDTIFHRLDTNPPVLQGGGFGLQPASGGGFTFPTVANSGDPTLANEFSASLPDSAGTLAMAKLGGDPNSATSEFFFNLADNSTTLGASNNGGFAVFGSVASDATSQAVFNALQATPVQNESAFNSAFSTLPVNSGANLTSFPNNTKQSDYLVINDVRVVKQDESLTYSVVGNSNPSLVNVQTEAGHPEVLSIQPVGASGTATITVQATDLFGASVQTSFQVTVMPLGITSATDPVTAANVTSAVVSGTATAGDSISVTATDGANTTTAVTVTAGSDGTWTSPKIDVSSLSDGKITYTATTTDAAGDVLTANRTATKNTIAPVTVSSVTSLVVQSNEKNTSASGTTKAGDTVMVTVTDGTTTTTAVKATVDASGNWTVTGIDVSSLQDGTITYTATATDPTTGNVGTATRTTTKNTVAPTISFDTVTDPIIDGSNDTATIASGVTVVRDTVSVTATDGTTKVTVPATVDPSGNWTATGIDVSGLQDGTITYTATATDPTTGNIGTATKTATKGP